MVGTQVPVLYTLAQYIEGVSLVFWTTVKLPHSVQLRQLVYSGPVQDKQE
jgi:hypothetical protein